MTLIDTRFKLWFDCEVTDFDPQKGAMHQVAAVIEIDDEVIDRIDIKMDSSTYPNQAEAILEFIDKIEHYQTHFVLCGHNVIKHDLRFLEEWFWQNGKNIYDYITYNPIDTLPLAIVARDLGELKDLEGNSLKDLCEYFNVPFKDWHTATKGAEAARLMYTELIEAIRG